MTSAKKRVLISEDGNALTKALYDSLVRDGFDVEACETGPAALRRANEFVPDLVLLDLVSLDGGSFDILPTIASGTPPTPIIIVSAVDNPFHKVRAFELGAYDYITKPFVRDELLARIRAILGRIQKRIERLVLGDVVVTFSPPQAWKGTHQLNLTQREFDALRYLGARRGQVVTREELLRAVWGYRHLPGTRLVDSLISRLRRKLEERPKYAKYLYTVYGEGYRLIPDD
jgi:DNA-binding response OmpR family regulator